MKLNLNQSDLSCGCKFTFLTFCLLLKEFVNSNVGLDSFPRTTFVTGEIPHCYTIDHTVFGLIYKNQESRVQAKSQSTRFRMDTISIGLVFLLDRWLSSHLRMWQRNRLIIVMMKFY